MIFGGFEVTVNAMVNHYRQGNLDIGNLSIRPASSLDKTVC